MVTFPGKPVSLDLGHHRDLGICIVVKEVQATFIEHAVVAKGLSKVLGQGIHHLLVTTTVRPTVGRHLHLEASIGRSDLMELHCFISKKGKEKGKAGQQGEGKRRAHHPPLRKIRTHRVIPTLDVTLILSH